MVSRRKNEGPQTDWTKCRDDLYQLLKERGPMPKRRSMEALGYSGHQINNLLIMFSKEFQKLTFVQSGRTRNRLFHDLVKASMHGMLARIQIQG